MAASVLSSLEQTLARTPDKEAVVHGDRSATFAQLDVTSAGVASALRSSGVAPGDRVGICMPKSIDQVVNILGVLRAGAVVVPIHPVFRRAQIDHIADDCGMKLLMTGDGVEVRRDDAHAAPAGDDVAAIIYSSGSTGAPKGIVISHANLADGARIVSSYLGTSADDRIAAVPALGFDYGLNQLWQTLATGATLHLHDLVFPRDLFALVAERRITALPLMPVMIARLFDRRLGVPTGVYPSVRYVCTTGGPVTQTMIDDLQRAFPEAAIHLMYGLTEAFRSTTLPPYEVSRRPTSIGKEIPEVEIHVLDERGEPCAPGEAGELVHRGGCIALGYWNAPEATAQRFRTIPRFGDETVVFSGDLVRTDDDGFLYFVGRKDWMIKTHGFRVSPTEVEEVASRHPSVTASVAFGVPNPEIGQDIVLVYTTDDQTPLADDDLLGWLADWLPGHMIPRRLRHEASLPVLSGGGKIDRVAVRSRVVS